MKKRKPVNSDNRADGAGSEIHPSSFILRPSGQSPIFHPSNRVEVVAAVIMDQSGKFLLAQRPAGKVYAGYWEFPGGKVEPGEAAADALRRELREELGIEAITCYPWLTRDFDYSHASVRLRFFRVLKWSGEPHGRERQELSWQQISNVTVTPLLPANGPILRALELPPVYGITSLAELGRGAFLARLEQSLRNGLRLVQVREKQLGDEALRELAAEVVALGHRFGARVVINGSFAVAAQVDVDGVHLTAAQLMAATRRPDCEWCGASCHDAAELDRARELGIDFVVLGPVKATPSHPGAKLLGWEGLADLIRDYPLPVYALSGLCAADLEQAWQTGAHGVAMVRGAWSG